MSEDLVIWGAPKTFNKATQRKVKITTEKLKKISLFFNEMDFGNASGMSSTALKIVVRVWLASEVNDIQKIKVGGYIKPNSIDISEDDQLEVSFFVYQNNDSVKVTYYGIRPDLFKDDAEVVVSGSYANSLISATELQTKCASRYEGDLKNIEKI